MRQTLRLLLLGFGRCARASSLRPACRVARRRFARRLRVSESPDFSCALASSSAATLAVTGSITSGLPGDADRVQTQRS